MYAQVLDGVTVEAGDEAASRNLYTGNYWSWPGS